MPDWGTKIVDAGGSVHDLAKNAFDGLSNKLRQPLSSADRLLQGSFDETFKTLKGRAGKLLGVENADDLNVEEIGRELIKGVSGTVGRFTLEAVSGAVLAKAGGKFVEAAEGPLGILISEAVTIGISEFAHSMTGISKYSIGQWVLLDLGMRTRRVNEAPTVVQMNAAHSIFGDDYYTLPDDMEYSEEPHHGVGFVMGHVEGDYIWTVFNFENGKEQEFHEDKIRQAPIDLAEKFDQNPEFSLIREIKFLKDHDPTLKSYVPSNPGDPVFYKGERYLVVQSKGNEFVIEAADGSRKHVHSDNLEAGKTLVSGSWNHELLNEGTFTSLSPDALFSGEWVWIDAGQTFLDKIKSTDRRRLKDTPVEVERLRADSQVLALVESLEGEKVLLVRAYDGKEVLESIKKVRPAKQVIQHLLDAKRESAKFKSQILEGHVTDLYPLGISLPALTLGIGEGDLTADNTSGMRPHMSVQEETKPYANLETFSEGGGRLGTELLKRPLRDELDERFDLDGTDRYERVVIGEIRDSDDGTTMPMGLILAVGVVLFLSAVY